MRSVSHIHFPKLDDLKRHSIAIVSLDIPTDPIYPPMTPKLSVFCCCFHCSADETEPYEMARCAPSSTHLVVAEQNVQRRVERNSGSTEFNKAARSSAQLLSANNGEVLCPMEELSFNPPLTILMGSGESMNVMTRPFTNRLERDSDFNCRRLCPRRRLTIASPPRSHDSEIDFDFSKLIIRDFRPIPRSTSSDIEAVPKNVSSNSIICEDVDEAKLFTPYKGQGYHLEHHFPEGTGINIKNQNNDEKIIDVEELYTTTVTTANYNKFEMGCIFPMSESCDICSSLDGEYILRDCSSQIVSADVMHEFCIAPPPNTPVHTDIEKVCHTP
ncbi:hypothetical protein DICVIV_09177 [Dictyocaulus viviparus]|uniref:Uncharacterized protein n=1 Tax=Dictyocaulus viviparus TaxID=29172 RepID=A0A0D8XJL8_DICVI|nr:hypothetical protein DICVIV_09177 [Dictyocaulus viviparus]